MHADSRSSMAYGWDEVYTGPCGSTWLSAIAHDSLHKVQTFASAPGSPETNFTSTQQGRLGWLLPHACTQVPSRPRLRLELAVFDYARSCHHADEVPAAVDLSSWLRRVRLGWPLVQVVVHAGETRLWRLLMGRARACLRLGSTPARCLCPQRPSRFSIVAFGLWPVASPLRAGCASVTGPPAQWDEQVFGDEAEKGTRAANGECSPADQKKRPLHHFSGAAGVVVPTSLPKLLYRKLPRRAVKRR